MEKSRTHRKSNLSLQISKKTGILSPTSKSGTGSTFYKVMSIKFVKFRTHFQSLRTRTTWFHLWDFWTISLRICPEIWTLEHNRKSNFSVKFDKENNFKGYQGGVVREVKEKETGLIFAAKIYCTQDEERISLVLHKKKNWNLKNDFF